MNYLKGSNKSSIWSALQKTRGSLIGHISEAFKSSDTLETLWDDVEDILLASDIGFDTTNYIIQELKNKSPMSIHRDHSCRFDELRTILTEMVNIAPTQLTLDRVGPSIILMVGVNGVGKTTSIAKLTSLLLQRNKTVLIGAGDTYRAAAISQLQSWATALNVDMVSHQIGSDPSAVAFDTIRATRSRNMDVAIIDTAGRLHGKANLIEELKKIYRTSKKAMHGGSLSVMLTVDASTGQNGLAQASHFQNQVHCDSIFLSKLDGTSKGGIVFPIVRELSLPISFVGTGEHHTDIAPFDPHKFVEGLFENTSL